MQIDQDIESWLRLGLTEGVGGSALRRLLVAFGDPAEVLLQISTHLKGCKEDDCCQYFSAQGE